MVLVTFEPLAPTTPEAMYTSKAQQMPETSHPHFLFKLVWDGILSRSRVLI